MWIVFSKVIFRTKCFGFSSIQEVGEATPQRKNDVGISTRGVDMFDPQRLAVITSLLRIKPEWNVAAKNK